MSANQTQVGGSHYRDMKIQPVDYIHANGLGYMEGCVIKYVSRHKSKGGKQDLEKAKHFLELLIERQYPEPTHRMLKETDTILEGDEIRSEHGCWHPVEHFDEHMTPILVGLFRRPIAKGSK